LAAAAAAKIVTDRTFFRSVMERDENEQPRAEPSKLPADWDTDTFPSSAKNVFLWAGAMFGGIVLLCSYVYLTSEKRPQKAEAVNKKKAVIEENVAALNADEDGDEAP